MLPRRPGPLALALATIGLGVLALAVRDFAFFWQPVPAWIGRPAILAGVCGVVLVSAGAGLFFARTQRACAWGLALFDLLWVLARGTTVLHGPSQIVAWESL